MDASLKSAISSYLQLPLQDIPDDPVLFLRSYLQILPESFLKAHFSWFTPKQRSVIPAIRNRRFGYTKTNPSELSSSEAQLTWPTVWAGTDRDRPTIQQHGENERHWAQDHFMDGSVLQVGKFASLLRDYEEERQAEQIRAARRQRQPAHAQSQDPPSIESHTDDDEFVPEEDSDSDDDIAETTQDFGRRIHELFIYGLLDYPDYDSVDWNDAWDDTREDEDSWIMNDSD